MDRRNQQDALLTAQNPEQKERRLLYRTLAPTSARFLQN